MIPLDQYPHIPYWFTYRQAIAEMEMSVIECAGRKSLPRAVLVFDEQYQLMGTLRRRDILRGLEPRFVDPSAGHHERSLFDIKVDPNLLDISSDQDTDMIRRRADEPIEPSVTPIETTVDFEDPLVKVISVMLLQDLNLVPVMKDDQVVGVVRSVDVFHTLADQLL